MKYAKPSFKTHPQLHWLYMYIAGKCNLRCRHCWIDPEPADSPPREGEGYLPYDLFLKALDEGALLGLRGVKYTGGEPLLHPRFADMLREGKKRGLSQAVETNGTLITPELAEVMAECAGRVSVSLDGATAETHDSFRGVERAFERTLNGMQGLRDAGLVSQKLEAICILRAEVLDELGEYVERIVRLGFGNIKFNLMMPLGRANGTLCGGIAIEEIAAIVDQIETGLPRPKGFSILVDVPPSFRLSALDRGLFLGALCGFKYVLGLLSNGVVSLCGIGYHIDELCFGRLDTGPLRRIWLGSRGLDEIRERLPVKIGEPCSSCILRSACMGKCVACNFYVGGQLTSGNWLCAQAVSCGAFAGSLLVDRRKRLASQEVQTT